MANFTPVSAAIGGALIGLAATLLMLINGRMAGISGMLAACLDVRSRDRIWSAAFIAGLVLAPVSSNLVVAMAVGMVLHRLWQTRGQGRAQGQTVGPRIAH